MKLMREQQVAFDGIMASKHSRTLGGYAGTGKTTVIQAIAKECKILALAPTGKACQVLREKGIPAQTIHSLIYNSRFDGKRFINTEANYTVDADMIVVDEASMVSEKFYNLLNKGYKVLYVGDHGQLPPVHTAFDLMKDPHYTLTEVHRQAKGNPIIALSKSIREGDRIIGDWSQRLENIDCHICFDNRTRVNINKNIRRGRLSMLEAGEKVMFLENIKKTFNGEVVTVNKIGSETPDTIDFDGYRVVKDTFGQCQRAVNHKRKGIMADYGYAMTCHKSQGSEFDSVGVYLTSTGARILGGNLNKWLYTAVTRAKKHLYLEVEL